MRLQPTGPLAAASRHAASALAALLVATSSPLSLPCYAAPPPTTEELSRLTAGLARIDFLLDNWEDITTVCTGYSEADNAQVVRTLAGGKCTKSPLKVQKYIGASSTKDPLFKADKLMIRAQPLIAGEDDEAYTSAVDKYITQQQMSSTMAYTSSWSGYENPGGSEGLIEENLLEAKKEVVETRATLNTIVTLLKLEKQDWQKAALKWQS